MGFGPFACSGDLAADVQFIAREGIKGEALIADMMGDCGQDRESYSDDQDRDSYFVPE